MIIHVGVIVCLIHQSRDFIEFATQRHDHFEVRYRELDRCLLFGVVIISMSVTRSPACVEVCYSEL